MTTDLVRAAEADGPDHAVRRAPRPGVIIRITQILDVFFTRSGRLLLDDVCEATGLPRSTTFRMLTQLVELHWLEHTDRGYRLGLRARGLHASAPEELRNAAAPILNELHLRTRAVAHLATLEGRVVHYLDKVGGSASTSVPSRVGARLTPDRTVSGKCLLASMAPEEVDTLLTIDTDHGRTPTDLAELHRELDQIRIRRGVAIDAAERCGMGITAVAAPVLGPKGPLGSISVASRDDTPARVLAPLVVAASRRVSETLGYGSPRRRPA